jgi:hypothetical protein
MSVTGTLVLVTLARMSHGNCAICKKHEYVQPLHGAEGGPLCCIMCAGEWHGKHGRLRRLGRIVIRAMAAYVDGGGSYNDIGKLQLNAFDLGGLELDPLGYLSGDAKTTGETIELTSELLADAIKIAHPDLHPPERRELAHRVTQGLTALQPFTFPAATPKPTPKPKSETPAANAILRKPTIAPKGKPYPCKECSADVPYYYCADCRAEWERRQQQEREKQNAARREWYARRKRRRELFEPSTICICGAKFKGKRADARFCSDTCRQRAHRGVTDKSSGAAAPAQKP